LIGGSVNYFTNDTAATVFLSAVGYLLIVACVFITVELILLFRKKAKNEERRSKQVSRRNMHIKSGKVQLKISNLQKMGKGSKRKRR